MQLAVDAISDALDGRELSRDDLHEQLRQRLPGELLPWCEGCQSHHARRGLLVMATLQRPAVHLRRAPGASPRSRARTSCTGGTRRSATTAGAELVRRYRATYGPRR